MSAAPDRKPKILELEARFENLDQLRNFVGEQAEICGLDPKAVYAVQLAADEAFTNIVEHAYGGECDKLVECTCLITGTGLVVTLRDCGQPFNPGAVPPPNIDGDLEQRKIGGLGLYFIRELMDEVDFTFSIDHEAKIQCNILRMVKLKKGTH